VITDKVRLPVRAAKIVRRDIRPPDPLLPPHEAIENSAGRRNSLTSKRGLDRTTDMHLLTPIYCARPELDSPPDRYRRRHLCRPVGHDSPTTGMMNES
jgi:hypothetical protein